MFPRGRFMRRFLPAILVWSVAIGAFNPFYNTYFSRRLHLTPQGIGTTFAASQLLQIAAVLLAPLILKRTGLVSGVMSMQLGTAAALGFLAAGPSTCAVAAYAVYMALQSMSEPGIYTMLMSNVREEERSGASSINFLAIFTAQAITAAVAGLAFARFGYPAVLTGAALAAMLAAVMFGFLLRRFR